MMFLCLFIFLASATMSVVADPGIIKLQETCIDASQPSVLADQELVSAATLSGEYQFIVQPKKNFSFREIEEIQDFGLSVIGIIPPNAYIVLGTKEEIVSLADRFELLYVGEYLPEYKTEKAYAIALSASEEKTEPVRIRLASKKFSADVQAYLQNATTNEIVIIANEPPLLETCLKTEDVLKLTKRSDILRVHKRGEYSFYNDVVKSNILMNVAYIHNELGLKGKGVTVAVADSGLDTGNTNTLHPDFQNKQLKTVFADLNKRRSWSDLLGHGTHVSGSVCGTGVASGGQYCGIAPEADLYFICNGNATPSVFNIIESDVAKAHENDAKIINNSWGSNSDGNYDTDSELYDTLSYNYPDLLLLFGAGNSNTGIDVYDNVTISPQASAKNVLAVGAAESFRPEEKTSYRSLFLVDEPFKDDLIAYPANEKSQGMAAFSSRGPTHDGRNKPDIVAPGTAIMSAASFYDGVNRGERLSYYTSKSGTSMATPLVSGSAAVVIQYLRDQGISNPSSALVKAVLLNGTRSMGTGQYKGYVEIPNKTPNWVNGFGHLDLGNSIMPTNSYLTVIEGVISNTSELVTYCFNKYTDGEARFTLVWTDPPSTPGVGIDLINDLDLQVKTKERTYYANNKTSHNDSINNCETYRTAKLVAQDNIEVRVHGYNVMKGPQKFALAITGMDEGPIPEPSSIVFLLLTGLFYCLRKNKLH